MFTMCISGVWVFVVYAENVYHSFSLLDIYDLKTAPLQKLLFTKIKQTYLFD